MHKMYEYLCDELKDYEKKVESGQHLSMSELEYVDKLAELKKNLLKIEMLEDGSEYSNGMSGTMGSRSYRGTYDGSYARGRGRNARRDAMGRYSSEGYSRADDFRMELQELMQDAPNEHVRQKLQNLMSEM